MFPTVTLCQFEHLPYDSLGRDQGVVILPRPHQDTLYLIQAATSWGQCDHSVVFIGLELKPANGLLFWANKR